MGLGFDERLKKLVVLGRHKELQSGILRARVGESKGRVTTLG
jgi:hypothetical protein